METSDPNLGLGIAQATLEPLSPWRQKTDRFLAGVIEAVVLVLVCLSPWAFGAIGTTARLSLASGLAALLALWGGRLLLQGCLVWQKCSVTVCLALGFLAGTAQLATLPPSVLNAVAPRTANFYERVLPAAPEVLPDGGIAPSQARRMLSLDGHATRAQIMDLLTIFLLFAAVRNNLLPVPALRRLGLAATANGALLGLFVLAQVSLPGLARISSNLGDEAGVWGPFLHREHFTAYTAVSIGLALGSILSLETVPERFPSRRPTWMLPILGTCLALMLGSMAFCHLPASLVAMGVSAGLVWLLLMRTRVRTWMLAFGSLACAAVLAGVLASASGAIAVASWSRVLAHAKEFPLFGTGLGTFAQVASNQGFQADTNPTSLADASAFQILAVEAGALGVTLTLLALGLIFRQGYQAFRRDRTTATSGLAIGSLFGITALLVHGFFAAGVPTPALAVLATVMCGHLCGLANSNEQPDRGNVPSPAISIRLIGLAPSAGMLALLLLGLALVSHARRADTVEKYAQAALLRGADDAASHQRRVQYLQTAVHLAPGNVRLRLELADAHHQLLEVKLQQLRHSTERTEAALIAQALAASGHVELGQSAASLVVAWWLPMNWQNLVGEKEEYLEKQHRRPALAHYIEARNASPLYPEPHLRIADSVPHLQHAERPGVYTARAKWIAPRNPGIFYQSGIQEADNGETNQARESWRHSLELSDGFLTRILDRCRDDMSAEQMLQRLLADRPQQLISAAVHLYPDPMTAKKQRRPFLEKALALLREQPTWSARDHYLAATAYCGLDQLSEGSLNFEKALGTEHQQISWRYEYARFLYEAENLGEAEKQLLTILDRQPGHKRASDFLKKIRDRSAN